MTGDAFSGSALPYAALSRSGRHLQVPPQAPERAMIRCVLDVSVLNHSSEAQGQKDKDAWRISAVRSQNEIEK